MIICHLAGLILLQSHFLAGILFPRKSLILTNGFAKKTQKTPSQEIYLAEQ
ncbi:type II toxin-antitoxin system RelE/ParE family toxin [Microcystis aeruginosa CS-564/01]|uniref:Type II toxin-antitoxin system RelE/ParE family toxin n=1 Tax=Microcystis aeruginosa BLCC-F158 TaxID=2755316 RepID=A0A841V143_MICAE|nr:type II toxin-antitoxin system RelE/ParE family toxin [Microcystis aeruginosa]MBC1194784.1 type II toxin-antitoxin system RelE/ParE family toxin [Microcystis aeruginosa BLCC-F158]MDB9423588.1 type II toxin-antitoxin system RelE/ParE family toxin [Microcystis aeruginosa CS-564/01]